MNDEDFRKLFEIISELCYLSAPEARAVLLEKILEALKEGEN